MCGVIGGYVVHPQRIKGHVKSIYMHQKTRGTQGFGLGIRKQDGTMYRKRTEDEGELWESKIWSRLDRGDYFLFHHRMPTSTPNIRKCNHPIFNEDKDIMMVHNGVLQQSHLQGGHKFETGITDVRLVRYGDGTELVLNEIEKVTDSEWAVHRIEELLDGKTLKDSLHQIGEDWRSTFLYMSKDMDGIAWVARNHPLWFYKFGGNHYMSSQKGIITSDRNLKETKVTDLDPAYGVMSRGAIDWIEEKKWNVTYTNTRSSETWHNGAWQGRSGCTPQYTEYERLKNLGITDKTYVDWLKEKDNTDDKEEKTSIHNGNESFVDDLMNYLPPNTTLREHLLSYPECVGLCEECTEFECFNNPVHEPLGTALALI